MNTHKWIGAFMAILVILISSCSPQPAPASPSQLPIQAPTKALTATPSSPATQTPTKPVSQTTAKPTWQEDWDKTLAAAKNEGRVVVYTNAGAETRQMLTKMFKGTYSIDLEFLAATGSELVPKIEAERRAGLYIPDCYMSGISTTISDLKPKGYLDTIEDKLVLPEVLDNKVWYGGKRIYADNEQKYIILQLIYPALMVLINSDKVKPGEVDSYKSLLDPKWKGKVSIQDPTLPGAGQTIFGVVGGFIMDFDFWRAFAKQEPLITRERRLQVEWVAREKHLITLGSSTPIVAEFMNAGAPLQWIDPKEGSFLATTLGISIFDKAPHPNASKIFINWLLTKDVATEVSKSVLLQSSREDVPTSFLDPLGVRKPGVKYYSGYTTEDTILRDPEFKKMSREIFGPLMK